MIFDCSEELRYAIKLRSLRTGNPTSGVIVDSLLKDLTEELKEAREFFAKGGKPAPTKRGRKPKGG